jgi:hypothetical protein
MRWGLKPRIRHPLFADLAPIPASTAKGNCTALYGTFPEIARAAAAGVTVERAVFVLVGPSGPFLSDADRDLVWNTFGVPGYALLTDGSNRILGYECELFAAFHVVRRIPQGLGGYHRETALCECGRPGERLFRIVAAEDDCIPEPSTAVSNG